MKFTYSPDAKPVDGFTIRRGLHRGGFGEVYYAVSDAGKEVALKLLTHDLDTELRGIRQCLNLKHPNLVTIFDVRTDAEGDTWVVMEYVSGASLEDVLAAFPMGLPLDEVRDWMAGILAGTEYLHGRGIVHRDLKPANIYRENGVVKIGDVGLSKQMGGTRRQHTEAVGTVYYMAPEVAKGQYGPEVDVYSLGVMLYEMLTGRLPFDGETTGEILMKHLASAPDLTGVTPFLRPVIAKALEKDPEKRTRSARQLAIDLAQVFDVEPLADSAFEPPPIPVSPIFGDAAAAADQGSKGSPAADRPPVIEPEPRHGGYWHRPRENQTRRTRGSIVSEVLDGVRARVRDRVDRALEKERRRHEKRMMRSQLKPVKPAKVRNERRDKHWGRLWPWLVLGLLVFVPWQTMSWGDIGVAAGMIALWGGLFAALDYLTVGQRSAHSAAVASLPLSVPQSRVSRWERIAAATLLGCVSAALLTVLGLFTWMQFEPRLSVLQPNDIAWLTLAACLGTVAVVTVFEGFQRVSTSTAPAGQWVAISWVIALSGLVLGAVVGELDEFLAVRDAVSGPARPAIDQLGSHRLAMDGHVTTAAYMLFFAASLWLQKWDQLLDPCRKVRLRLGPVAWAALIGYLGSVFSGIPVQYAVLWSTAITAAAQVAAPWDPTGSVQRVPLDSAA